MSKRLIFLLGLFVSANVVCAGTEPAGVLVVPNRYTLIQFGFDMLNLRPVRLVSYDVKAKPGESGIFLWNPATRAWDRIDAGRYGAGFGAKQIPVVVVRDPGGMPAAFETAPGWSSDMKQLDSPNLAELANLMNDRLRFNEQEWRWLAPRYGLGIRDLNEERRRYGRYGKPGQGPLRPAPEKEKAQPAPLPEAGLVAEETAPALDAGKKPAPVAEPPKEEISGEPFEKGDAVKSPDVEVPEAKTPEIKVPELKGSAAAGQTNSLEDVPAVELPPKAAAPSSGRKEPAPSADSDSAKAAAILDAGSKTKTGARPPPDAKIPDAPLAMDK